MSNQEKKQILFVCVHNSARSQMAEAYLNKLGGDRFIAESAGLEPGELNPLAVAAMEDDGINIMNNHTKSVFDMREQGRSFDYVITVCDESQGERCPIFPGQGNRLHWGFEDPSAFKDMPFKEALQKTIGIRDQIKGQVKKFIEAGQ